MSNRSLPLKDFEYLEKFFFKKKYQIFKNSLLLNIGKFHLKLRNVFLVFLHKMNTVKEYGGQTSLICIPEGKLGLCNVLRKKSSV